MGCSFWAPQARSNPETACPSQSHGIVQAIGYAEDSKNAEKKLVMPPFRAACKEFFLARLLGEFALLISRGSAPVCFEFSTG
jgi:hypothetical protein